MTPREGISVQVLTYNHERYIGQCLESIAAQNYGGPLEIIVFDDASTDATADRVREAAERDPRIKLIVREKNLGAARNFASALDACRGPYLAFCEGDDFWNHPEKLSMQADVLDRSPEVSLVYTDYAKADTAGRILPGKMPGPQPDAFRLADLLTDHGPSTNTVMVRRSALERPFPEVFFEVPNPDVFIFAAALAEGTGKHLPVVTGTHRLHDGGIWSSRSAAEQKLMRLGTRLALLSTLPAERRKSLRDTESALKSEFEAAMYAAAAADTGLFQKYAGRLTKGALRKILWNRRLGELKQRIRQGKNTREG